MYNANHEYREKRNKTADKVTTSSESPSSIINNCLCSNHRKPKYHNYLCWVYWITHNSNFLNAFWEHTFLHDDQICVFVYYKRNRKRVFFDVNRYKAIVHSWSDPLHIVLLLTLLSCSVKPRVLYNHTQHTLAFSRCSIMNWSI